MHGSEKKKSCFVVGPIGADGSETRKHADWLYETIIKPAFDSFADFSVPVRADKISQPGMITTQVIEQLLEAELVIADLSLANPNAFYEIGIRHMVQKPIIHMQLKNEMEPFDTRGFRAIKFALQHPTDLSIAQRELVEAIKSAISSGHRIENPVTHAVGLMQFEKTATPGNRVILEELRSLSERLSHMERLASPKKVAPIERAISFWDIEVEYEAGLSAETMSKRLTQPLSNAGAGTKRITFSEGRRIGIDFIDPKLSPDKVEAIAKGIAEIEGVARVEI